MSLCWVSENSFIHKIIVYVPTEWCRNYKAETDINFRQPPLKNVTTLEKGVLIVLQLGEKTIGYKVY